MAKIYYDKDADSERIKAKKVAVIGYGSQGHAHALSLQDSGVDVRVGLREGSKSWAKAEAHGLAVDTVDAVAAWADTIMILAPDTAQANIYAESVAPHLASGDTLMFAHGFNIRYKTIVPPRDVDVSMVAPKAPGHRVREVFVEGGGTPCLVAVEQDASGEALANALSYARAIGGTRRRDRNHLCRGDGNRPLRRANHPLRRRQPPGQGRLRDAGRGGLPAGNRLF